MTLDHSAADGQSVPRPRPPLQVGVPMVSTRKTVRYSMMALGLVCTVLGIIGIILPVMPGTVFLLIAAWAFSRSSERLHLWLYYHPRFGQTIRDWHLHRVIPVRGKLLAITMMAMSFAYVAVSQSPNWLVPALVGATLLPVAIWIATRPSGDYSASEISPR
jgi:uncharacterized membrane protein YbaN (DUF454 family)